MRAIGLPMTVLRTRTKPLSRYLCLWLGAARLIKRYIGQAIWCNVSVRSIATGSHPDHDTITKFRRKNGPAFQAAFAPILILTKELCLLRSDTVSMSGTKVDANAPTFKLHRGFGRAQGSFHSVRILYDII